MFQYDLQFVQVDEDFFRDKQWYALDSCLTRCMSELNRTYARWGTVPEAIRAYNGAGKRAEIYAEMSMHYSKLADDVLAATNHEN